MPLRKSDLPYLAPLALLLGVCLYHSRVVPWSDFAGYYTGSHLLLKGDYTAAYDMKALNDHIAAAGYKAGVVSYAPFPPFTSLIFAPFTILPMGMAKLLFNLLSALLFLFTVARAIHHFGISRYFALVIPIIFFIPIVNNIFFGQAYLLLCSLLLEG
ncbi:MAG TPA: glycosyltransferase 87 family protein, partial [Puia sp.]